MARSLSIVVVLLGLGGAAALFVVRARADGGEGQTALSELDARLRESAAGVHSRASTLAELPRLSAAVSTDSATVRDLTSEELAFRPKPGETIEIGQVFKSGNVVSLIRLPESGKALSLDPPGVHLLLVGGALLLTEVEIVEAQARADQLHGALAVGWKVDLSSVAARLDALGVAARLELGGESLPLSSRAIAAGAPTRAAPVTAVAGSGAQLVVEKTPVSPLPPVAVALASLVVAALLWRRKPAPALPQVVSSPLPSVHSGATPPLPYKLSEVGAAVPPVQQIGRYTILRPLGSGGMAEVYLARSTGEAGFEKLVALKVLHKQLALQPVVVEHFLDEAKLASRLTHPNIVQIADLGKAGDEYFIAMEFIDGADLEMLLANVSERHAQVPLKVALHILRKICDGLHAAHSAQSVDGLPLDLVHRDVKSANVFVARNGSVKIGDFGIAKANQASRVNKTEIGQVKGTAAYMSPEHRVGQPVDRRADIYAVGAIGYELVTGTEVNLDLAVLADRGKEGWPHLPKPTEIRPELPPELDALLWKALAYDKANRFPTCEAMEEALAAVVEKHNLGTNDKAVAQWVESEMALKSSGSGPVTLPAADKSS